ncbi:hypothetical protein M9Y90_11845 [Leptospira interrogans]|uniref:hypothetical protein n=1 Tax=Leptospira interrogans TaxID=173 RepID=UPI00202385AD|nr:hypothetical protein [Leptospira interrogans]MCL8311356.1 hypothetical protein [Leptospira interrogans]
MAKYKLRFFFDPGSGACLWGADDATKAKYDYPVDNRQLNLRDNTYRALEHLIAWYDTSINWDYPPDPTPWTSEEEMRFTGYKTSILEILRKELGGDFEVLDESQC